jgi:hypothetical protein
MVVACYSFSRMAAVCVAAECFVTQVPIARCAAGRWPARTALELAGGVAF